MQLQQSENLNHSEKASVTSVAIEPQSKLINDDLFLKLIYVNVIIATSIGVIGTLANTLTIVIFIKQGFKETINISLTCLALADMGSLICLTWMSTCYNPSFQKLLVTTFESTHMAYLFGAIPRSHFLMMGSCITAAISSERCVCVIRPLEVKYIMTKSRLLMILAVIFIVSLIPTVPLYYSTRLLFFYDANYNTTRVGIMFTEDRPSIDLQFTGVSVAIFVSAFIIVALSTGVIIFTLVSQSRWRAAMMTSQPHQSADRQSDGTPGTQTAEKEEQKQFSDDTKVTNQKNASLSPRDRRAAKTVSIIAAMFVVCYFPGMLNLLGTAFVPGFNTGGRYGNSYQFFWSVSHTAEAICSSANILVYIKNSTNFRSTLKAL